VLSAPAVRWARSAPDRHNVNFLTSDRLTDLGGGPTFYNCLVEMEKSGD
jgi:anaerobic selenocysteine-containing dehydrogenase